MVAVGLGALAVATLLQQNRTERVNEPVADSGPVAGSGPVVAASVPAPQMPEPRTWALRAGGWYIRVDGTEIAIPTFDEQTAAPPRASLAVSLSPFDHLILHHAAAEGFDWRLIAAVIFEESHFNPSSRSDKGAYGLMQVRPIAAEAVGEESFKAPDDNVRTGVRYLRQLDEMFNDAQGTDRLGLVLAAYNVGPGHVRDAQLLARNFGYDQNRWRDGIDLMLPLLEEPAIYQQLPNGFAHGNDTVAYVERVLQRYRRYKRDMPARNAGKQSVSSGSSANG